MPSVYINDQVLQMVRSQADQPNHTNSVMFKLPITVYQSQFQLPKDFEDPYIQ